MTFSDIRSPKEFLHTNVPWRDCFKNGKNYSTNGGLRKKFKNIKIKSTRHLRKDWYQLSILSSRKWAEGLLPNSISDTSITLIPKIDKGITTNYKPINFINKCKSPQQSIIKLNKITEKNYISCPSRIYFRYLKPSQLSKINIPITSVIFPDGSNGKASAYNAGDLGSIPGLRGSLEKEVATHSSTLAWKIPWTEERGRLQSMGSQRVWHNWATLLCFHINWLKMKNHVIIPIDMKSSGENLIAIHDKSNWETRSSTW